MTSSARRAFAFTFAALVLLACGTLSLAQTTATWNGGGDGLSYNDPDNWDIGVVPLDGGGTTYAVVVPGGHTVAFDVPGTGHQVFQFSLANGSTFRVNSGRELEVVDEAAVDGHVTTAGGSFIADSTASRFSSNHAQASASAAGQIRLAATTYDSQGNFANNSTRTMFSAQQAGSVLDLSSVQSWDASWNDNRGDYTTVQRVEAIDNGVVDLSSLQTLLTPNRSEDRIDFVADGGGTIDLSSLTTISGTGQARFDAAAGMNWTIPSLETASDLTFILRDGATFNTPVLTNLSDLTVTFNSGATLNLPQLETINGLSITWTDNEATLNAPQATALTSSVLSLETGCNVITGALTNIDNTRLFVADGLSFAVEATTYDSQSSFASNSTRIMFSAQQSGSLLDLSTIQEWNASWNDNRGDYNTAQRVEAIDGAVVDLSGLQTLYTPDRAEDRVDFVASSGGTIDLSSLSTISGTGQAYFDAAAGMTWTLPSLQTASDLTLVVRDGATFSSPMLTTLSDLTVTFNSGATLNLPQLETINGLSITWTDNDATLNAPLVTAVTNSLISLEAGRIVYTGPLTNIDNSRLFVADGLSFAIEATTYDSQSSFVSNSTRTMFSAQQSGSLLDLSTIQEWDASWNDNRGDYNTAQRVEAMDGAVVDLSGLQTLYTPNRAEDRVDFVASSGGTIDLSSLSTISGTGQAYFDAAAGMTWTLPALETASDLTLILRDGATFNTPVLTTLSDLTVTFNSGATLHLPELETINGLSITWTDNDATLNAPLATALTNSVLSLTAGRNVVTGPMVNVDNSRLFIYDGLTFSVAATTYDSQSSFASNSTRIMFSAQQPGSLLDLSSIQHWNATWNDNRSDYTTAQRVEAIDGGVVDLSGLQTLLTPDRGEDRVDFVASSGGTIDLSSLSTISGAGQAYFDAAAGMTWTLPSLETASGLTLVLRDGATFEAPVLTNLSDLTITFNSGATLDLPQLETINGLSITWTDNDATLNAPQVTALTSSVLSLTTGRNVVTGLLTNIHNSRLYVYDGRIMDVAATTYDSQSNFASNSTRVMFSAQQPGSLLDLASIHHWDASWNDNRADYTTVQRVEALDGGTVDMSGLETLLTPNRGEDRVDFVASSGGMIDLSALSTISGTGQARLTINSGGAIRLGDLLQSGNARISVSDTASLLDVAGTLELDSGTLSIGTGATVRIGNRFSFSYTNEANFVADAGVFHLDGAGGQLFEVGGEDLGLAGPGSGNFGIGQLIIGQTAQRTSADLLDVIDNGNRGAGGEAEALYLYGLGGPDGLRILNDSALILNGINVYAWDAIQTQMVHLNSLFQPGDLRIEYDDGYLQLVPLDFEWDNPLGGDFNLPTNWSDDLLPLASDSALWNLGSIAGYTVQFGTNVATDAALILNDRVTYDLGGFTYSTSGLHATESLVIGLSATDSGRLTISNGTFAGTSARVAANGTSFGMLTVAGTGSLDLSENLTLGAGDATLRVESGGTAHVGDTLLVAASSRVELAGGTVTIGSGALEQAASTMRIHGDGTLSAAGTIDGALVNEGLVMTGPDPAILNVTGDLDQTATGTLELAISGNVPGVDQDQLLVGGDVVLSGRLDLFLDETLALAYGDAFNLIDATGSVTGLFDVVTGLSISPTQSLAVVYDPTDVLAIIALPGDANLDGVVDTSDFNVWNSNKFATTSVSWSDGDFNGDGVVDTSDFNIWNENKFTSAAQSVPEPSGLFWLISMLLLAASQRRAKTNTCIAFTFD